MPDFNRYETAKTILDRTLRSMGLPVPVSYVGSTDALAIQVLELLTEGGRELATTGNWQMFQRTWTFSTTPPTLNYDIPQDVRELLPSTGWNLTARVPLIGPISPQQWALLEARQLGGTTLYMQFVPEQDQLQFYFVPSDVQNISIKYVGRGWVRDDATSTTYRDYIDNDNDIILYDSNLMQMMVKLKWRENKGFDTTRQQKNFDDYLAVVKAKDCVSPDLNISRQNRYPYLGMFNLPDTGYGSSS